MEIYSLFAVLFLLFPGSPQRPRSEPALDLLGTRAFDAACDHGVVPLPIIVAVAFLEGQLRADRVGHTVAGLAHARTFCAGNWRSTVAFFLCRSCACPATMPGYSADDAVRLADRLANHTGNPHLKGWQRLDRAPYWPDPAGAKPTARPGR